MPDITDPTLIAWVNETVRPVADRTATLLYEWRRLLAEYDYLDAFPATQDEIVDGAQDDGRAVLVSQDIRGFRGVVNSMAGIVDTALELEKLLRPAVNYTNGE